MLTDDTSSLKVWKHCGKAFAANARISTIYKSRAKKNDTPIQED
jgi:hypothetical protein